MRPETPARGAGRIERWSWSPDFDRPRRWAVSGGVLAIPSESSYGLAVDAGNPRAVERVYGLKERQRGKPLPVVVADTDAAAALVESEHPLFHLAAEHWPAALTVVLPLRRPLAAAAGGTTLAIRVPAHPGLCRLLAGIDLPLTATSANRAGEPPILDPAELGPRLIGGRPDGRVVEGRARESAPGVGDGIPSGDPPPTKQSLLVVDDGILPGGPPSTLVDWCDGAPRVLRAGAYELPAPGRG